MARKTSNRTATLNVLLVDDDPDHRWMTRDAIGLTDMPCHIREASSAEEALEILTGGEEQCEWVNPDVIYLDVELPGMDGLTLLSQIKSNPRLRNIMVVVVTGSGDVSKQRQKALRNGAGGFIRKTNDTSEMMQALRTPIEQCSVRAAAGATPGGGEEGTA